MLRRVAEIDIHKKVSMVDAATVSGEASDAAVERKIEYESRRFGAALPEAPPGASSL